MKQMLPERYGIYFFRHRLMSCAGKLLLVFGLLILSACSANRSSTYSVKVVLTQSRSHFTPSTLVIPVGSKVVWQNQSIYPVTVTCDPSKVKTLSTNNDAATGAAYVKLPSDADPWDSGTLYTGQTWSYIFKTPGEYLYFSQYDQTPDLVGVVKVQ